MEVMIRCKVRPDGVEAGLELLQEVYEEMRSVQPKGLRHATFQLVRLSLTPPNHTTR